MKSNRGMFGNTLVDRILPLKSEPFVTLLQVVGIATMLHPLPPQHHLQLQRCRQLQLRPQLQYHHPGKCTNKLQSHNFIINKGSKVIHL